MKSLIAALALIICLGSTAHAEESKLQAKPPKVDYQCPVSSDANNGTPKLLAGRGCCSHHKGQCGCEGGRVVCCDGTLSPSCRCQKDQSARQNGESNYRQ